MSVLTEATSRCFAASSAQSGDLGHHAVAVPVEHPLEHRALAGRLDLGEVTFVWHRLILAPRGYPDAMPANTDPTVARPDEEQLTKDQLIEALNDDLSSELQSIAQYVQHVAMITGAEFTSTVDELKVHITQEVAHAGVLAEQVAFLGGTPTTRARDVPAFEDSRGALESDLALEVEQLDRYRDRVRQATDLGLVDVAEALRPLLTQTQEHVRDLQAALGR